MRHEHVYRLTVRLLRGETIEHADEYGRRWRATADTLSLVLPGSGESAPVLEGADAYEVAALLAGHPAPRRSELDSRRGERRQS